MRARQLRPACTSPLTPPLTLCSLGLYLCLQERYVVLPGETKVHITRGQGEGEDQQQQEPEEPEEPEEGLGIQQEGLEDQQEQQGGKEQGQEGEGNGDEKQQQEQGEEQEGEEQQGKRQQGGGGGGARVAFQDPATLSQLRGLGFGCCVAALHPADAEALGLARPEAAQALALVCWRGRGSLNVMVGKHECAQAAERLLEAARQAGVALVPLAPQAAAREQPAQQGSQQEGHQQEQEVGVVVVAAEAAAAEVEGGEAGMEAELAVAAA